MAAKKKNGKVGGGRPRAAGARGLRRPAAEVARLIVGIGASAGGLDAFKGFFSRMPTDSGMAFVLIQHLNPDRKSLLTELIARQTTMPVREIEDGMLVAPNTVFVIPPNATLTLNTARFRVERPAPPRSLRHPIDTFFTSLGESHGEHAVAIVLAGTGSDGTLGVRAMKAAGGLTLAQAGFDHLALNGMPQSAAATGLVDHVMQVADMPAQLLEYERHLTSVAAFKDGEGARVDTEKHLAAISTLLRAAIGHDFGQYKQSTLSRRVQRRMQVLQIPTVPQFVERLRNDPPQLHLLFREFLIGVTQFFRDPQAFETLSKVGIGRLLEDSETTDTVRIWVPACATGEEVYSIAILMKEEMNRRGIARQVQIFGTDIDDAAVATARSALYPRGMQGMSPERIERWFVKQGDGYCPIKQIREMCIFSVHSVVRDPPFSKLDLISCRNLLIYFEPDLQERAIRSFHYGLKSGGILFLGPSEGISRGTKLFGLLSKSHRVFQRRTPETPSRLPDFLPVGLRSPERPAGLPAPAVPPGEDRIDRHARDVLEKYSPAYVVIDRRHDVVRFSGGAIGRYLEPSGGPPNLNLFSLLRRSLRPVVRSAVQKVSKDRQSVFEEQVSIRLDAESHALTIIAKSLSGGREDAGLCVVAFRDLGVRTHRKGAKSEPASAALDRELTTARAQLLSLAAELEAANENSASAAEEYQSVNEELQSSNEELETAKEEMQSINEELQTVNAELNAKNDQLMRSNSDLQNLLASTDIATIFLDADLRVKSFTPATTVLFHLRDTDRGRPLDEIVSRMAYGDLRSDVLGVLNDLKTVERELEIAGGASTFIMRIRPYRTLEGAIEGVVITFVDISGRRAMEEILREHAAIVQFSQDALIGVTPNGTVRSWNPAAERLFGYAAVEAIGQPIGLLGSPDLQEPDSDLLRRARDGAIAGPFETTGRHRDGASIDVELALVPILGESGTATGLALSARSIVERREADRHRGLLVRELSHRVKNALASVKAIATQTLRTAPTAEAFEESFGARLMALSKTHDLLTLHEWHGAMLREIVETELLPYQDEVGMRWKGEGPKVSLSAKAALALGMAFHELATNAAKYGAFSTPQGRVDVTWEQQIVGEESRLRVTWVEVGGPKVVKRGHRGFGTRLVADGLAHELDGEVTLDFDPAGVRCVIDIPMTESSRGDG